MRARVEYLYIVRFGVASYVGHNFRRRVLETLASWRFRFPGRRDSIEPKNTRPSWEIQYPPLELIHTAYNDPFVKDLRHS